MRQLFAGTRPLMANGQYLFVPDAHVAATCTLTPDTLALTKSAGGGHDLFRFAADQRFSLSPYVLIAGLAPAAVEVQLNAGAWLTITDFNSALSTADAALIAAGYTFTIRLMAADTSAVSLEITATYYG